MPENFFAPILGTADAVEVLDPEQMRGGQGLPRGIRRDDHDPRNARDTRRDHRHQQRGGQRMTPAGYVTADGLNRSYPLAGEEPGHR